MIQGKRVKIYDLQGNERTVMPHEAKKLKEKKKAFDKPKKKEEKAERTTKEEKSQKQTK
jgi:hypothetical protein